MGFIYAPEVGTATAIEEIVALVGLAKGRYVLEIGSHTGATALAMGSVASAVVCIDWMRGDDERFKDDLTDGRIIQNWFVNVQKYHLLDKVHLFVGRTIEVASLLVPGFEMVFIDGDHTHEGVCTDIDEARHLVNDDAVWAFHDYTDPTLGVKSACDEHGFGEPGELVGSLAVFFQAPAS